MALSAGAGRQSVAVMSGPFASFPAIVEVLLTDDRIRVASSRLGRPLAMERRSVELADELCGDMGAGPPDEGRRRSLGPIRRGLRIRAAASEVEERSSSAIDATAREGDT